MTIVSTLIAAAVAVILAAIIAIALRAAKLPVSIVASWSAAVGIAVAIPVLQSSELSDIRRAVWPPAALDWVSWGVLAIAVIQTIKTALPRWHYVWCGVLGITCVGFAGRLLWGSIYLRASALPWPSVASVIGWGLAICAVHILATRREQKHSVSQAAVAALVLACTAATIGMSGTATYAAVAALVALAAGTTWVVTRSLPGPALAAAVVTIGLARAYSETTTLCAVLLGASLIALTLAGNLTRGRVAALALAILLALTSTGIALQKFVYDLQHAESGYDESEMYK